jgi:hypothetical protein
VARRRPVRSTHARTGHVQPGPHLWRERKLVERRLRAGDVVPGWDLAPLCLHLREGGSERGTVCARPSVWMRMYMHGRVCERGAARSTKGNCVRSYKMGNCRAALLA